MKRRVLLFSALLILDAFILAASAPAQEPSPRATDTDKALSKPAKPQFFAGQVVEADAEHVKVSRTLFGRAPETRVFVLDGKTKTPKGGIKPKTRVTVRYEHLPEHDLALEIQVRSSNHAAKPS
jgi:hypothetical protein